MPTGKSPETTPQVVPISAHLPLLYHRATLLSEGKTQAFIFS